MAEPERIWTAACLVIGDEILSGRTQDKNIALVATWLNVQGIRLREARVVADDMGAIGAAVTALASKYDYVFTTGGIGPTHDDITIDAIATALDLPVVVHPEARALLEDYYASRGGLNDARLRMARAPAGASLIVNAASGAPGVQVGDIFVLAGVPHIAAAMLDSLAGTLEGGRPLVSATLGCWAQESAIASLLAETERAHAGCQIGSYPFFREGRTGANLVIRSVDHARLDACRADLARELTALGYDPVEGGI
jgi:molybdenum cofactor synthesis domain-containing protein